MKPILHMDHSVVKIAEREILRDKEDLARLKSHYPAFDFVAVLKRSEYDSEGQTVMRVKSNGETWRPGLAKGTLSAWDKYQAALEQRPIDDSGNYTCVEHFWHQYSCVTKNWGILILY